MTQAATAERVLAIAFATPTALIIGATFILLVRDAVGVIIRRARVRILDCIR